MKEELAADSGIASPQVTAITFLTLILSGFFVLCCEARVYDSDGSEASVQACIRSATDGDVVTIPAGTFTWTSALNITKGITLQGQTTITGAGTANPVIKDLTIVLDDTPRSGRSAYILAARMARGNQSFRLTGITFRAGSITTPTPGNGPIRLFSQAANIRVDHCHFDKLNQGRLFWVGGSFGVVDHCVMVQADNISQLGTPDAFLVDHGGWGGHTDGHGSFADYPFFGSDKFFFIEDNYFRFLTATDVASGGRYVFRHNYCLNSIVTDHGTEGGTVRGVRCKEVYGNEFNWNKLHNATMSSRGGSQLVHDNIITGQAGGTNDICTLVNYRESYLRPAPAFGIADGTSVWDANDTDGQGHFVEGQPAFIYEQGTATATSAEGTLTDSTKNWTTDQWRGYSIHKVGASSSYGSYIKFNTATTMTYAVPGVGHLIFNAGDSYELRHVITTLDMCGGGKSDLIQTVGNNVAINTTTGMASYAHTAIEPNYSWNNLSVPNGASLGFSNVAGTAEPTTKLNVHFFNLGLGFPANTTPPEVSNRYNAALNGVPYTGTFQYPHPLVSGAPTPTSSATGGTGNTCRKKKQKKGKKLKRRKGGKMGE